MKRTKKAEKTVEAVETKEATSGEISYAKAAGEVLAVFIDFAAKTPGAITVFVENAVSRMKDGNMKKLLRETALQIAVACEPGGGKVEVKAKKEKTVKAEPVEEKPAKKSAKKKK